MESRHNHVTKRKIAERRAELLEAMAGGLQIDTYMRFVGHVHGLDEAAKLGDDADNDLSGGS